MRITKLHLLLFFLLAGAGVYGAYFWREKEARAVREREIKALAEPAAPTVQQVIAALPVPPPVQEEPRSLGYTVKNGDTLWKIAKMKNHFGQGHRWYDIWKANQDKIADFDHVAKGTLLTIPLDKPDGYAWPKTKIPSTN